MENYYNFKRQEKTANTAISVATPTFGGQLGRTCFATEKHRFLGNFVNKNPTLSFSFLREVK
ncbi:hypothetical protein [Leptospira borgpetersenii]|uniref:hypothetical protein n=1 Tax=Leptospira borgpetersenii TaxID=174 RepID=UPI001651484F|nr:hypothetical protein [Leptospira borgpetersenii]